MSAKRPRPAIPVLVHVDNPGEVGSVTVDTSTIEGKMDTVINNQERIYNKIPSGASGSGTDLTTVNENTTSLAASIGPPTSTTSDNNMFGVIKNIRNAIGNYHTAEGLSDNTVKSRLRNIQTSIGDASTSTTETDSTVKGYLLSLKNNMGTIDSASTDKTLIGIAKNLSAIVGDADGSITPQTFTIRALLYNLRLCIGNASNTARPTYNDIRGFCMNIRNAIGNSTEEPTSTGTSVRDLLTAIKANTASGGGGGGGSADLTTVNEKTTALAAAIGSANDSSSTVSVIGLLKSITDKY